MQLEHDASFQSHSPFTRMSEFIEVVMTGFAEGAPQHHHLVFKAHPLENDRSPIRKIISAHAARLGVKDRVHYVRGGKLASLLDQARTAVTVNSTAGQQVLWRGIPLKVFGQAVYSRGRRQLLRQVVDMMLAPEDPYDALKAGKNPPRQPLRVVN